MKLARVARFDCDRSTQEFTCYMAVLVSPGDHACGWTTSALHSHLAWPYWFRWVCGASSGTSPVVESSRVCAYHGHQRQMSLKHSPPSSRTRANHPVAHLPLSRYGAGKHPLRRDAPDQKGCIAYGSGAPPHRHQACAWFFSLAPPSPECSWPRTRSTALDTTAMH